jgi:voltage-gated potassium channel
VAIVTFRDISLVGHKRYTLITVNKHNQRTIRGLILFVTCLALLGTLGFSYFAHLTPAEALYETVIILLTHYDHFGFTDTSSRSLVIVLILSSLGLVAYLLKWLAEYMMGLSDNVRRLRVKAKVEKLKDHYIVAGLGRVGSQVAGEMMHEKVPFIGLDRDDAKVNAAIEAGQLALNLDSSVEENLKAVGIDRAAGLVACLGEDSLNLFVVLAARALNPDIYIVARANRPENESKLKHAGANRVAMPYQIGGYHMASMALRPNVVDYMDIMTGKNGLTELEVEEMMVGPDSRLAGRRLGSALAEDAVGATVIAINGADGTSRVRPNGKEVIYPGDRLIILGSKPDLTSASELIR